MDDTHAIGEDGQAVGAVEAAPAFVVRDDLELGNADEAGPAFVSSESDDRKINNVQTAVRHAYRFLSEEEKALMIDIKDLGHALLEKISTIGSSRELSIARTKTEEAVMWAVKHITA